MHQEKYSTDLNVITVQDIDSKKTHYSRADAESICYFLSLISVTFGKYLVLTKPDFVINQPYLDLVLILNVESGKFLNRVQNQTVMIGYARSLEELVTVVYTLMKE